MRVWVVGCFWKELDSADRLEGLEVGFCRNICFAASFPETNEGGSSLGISSLLLQMLSQKRTARGGHSD